MNKFGQSQAVRYNRVSLYLNTFFTYYDSIVDFIMVVLEVTYLRHNLIGQIKALVLN